MLSITNRQRRVLLYLDMKIRENGVAPSYQEIADALGLYSKSTVFESIKQLEERGFIRKIPYKARCIEIIDIPPQSATPKTELQREAEAVLFTIDSLPGSEIPESVWLGVLYLLRKVAENGA